MSLLEIDVQNKLLGSGNKLFPLAKIDTKLWVVFTIVVVDLFALCRTALYAEPDQVLHVEFIIVDIRLVTCHK